MTPPAPITDSQSVPVFDRAATANLLNMHALVNAVRVAAMEMEKSAITCPARSVLPLGHGGVLLSMPATSRDLGVVKIVNVQPANTRASLPTIHGLVAAFRAETGEPLCILDAPELTGRRTAAVSMLALLTLLPQPPRAVLLIGTGVQAKHHMRALSDIFPSTKIWVRGISREAAETICLQFSEATPLPPGSEHVPDNLDAVITLTTSKEVIYDHAAEAGRLVIGVGAFTPEMAEIGVTTIAGSDLYADDPSGAQHEAGDLLRAQVDWKSVRSLGYALNHPPDMSRPIVFKSVGSAAWDLAACRVVASRMSSREVRGQQIARSVADADQEPHSLSLSPRKLQHS